MKNKFMLELTYRLLPLVSFSEMKEILDDYSGFMVDSQKTEKPKEVMKSLESARSNGLIGSGLEAKVVLHTNNELLKSFTNDELKDIFIVSEVELVDAQEFKVEVLVHEGKKCERCWSYHHSLHEIEGACVCERCKKVLENGKFF